MNDRIERAYELGRRYAATGDDGNWMVLDSLTEEERTAFNEGFADAVGDNGLQAFCHALVLILVFVVIATFVWWINP